MDPTRGSRFRWFALLRPPLRWVPLVALAAVFGAHLVRTTRHLAATTASLDRVTRGPIDTAQWVPVDDAVAEREIDNSYWSEMDFPALAVESAAGRKESAPHATADSGNLSLAHDWSKPGGDYHDVYRASLAGRVGLECDNEWQPTSAPHPHRAGILAFRQSVDRRTVQFGCALYRRGVLTPGEARWSLRFRGWEPTYPLRDLRLALVHRLEASTRLGWGLSLGAMVLALAAGARRLRRRPMTERSLGETPYRTVRVTERAPARPGLGAGGRLVCRVLALSAIGVGFWIGCSLHALDSQRLPTVTPPDANAAPPGFQAPERCLCPPGGCAPCQDCDECGGCREEGCICGCCIVITEETD